MLNAEYNISECTHSNQHTYDANAKCFTILPLNYALVLYLICFDCASKPIYSVTERIWFHFRVDASGWVCIFSNITFIVGVLRIWWVWDLRAYARYNCGVLFYKMCECVSYMHTASRMNVMDRANYSTGDKNILNSEHAISKSPPPFSSLFVPTSFYSFSRASSISCSFVSI